MSRSLSVLPLPVVDRRPTCRVPPVQAKRLAGVVSGVTFTALSMAASAPAFAAVDWPGCLHAAEPAARAQACTGIIGSTNDHKTLLRALNSRGNALCATADRCREAIPDFASVVKLAPDVAGYHDNLARALRAAQRYPDALQESDRAIGLAPKYAFVYVGKARTLAAAGRGAEALAVVQVAMAVAPVDAGLLEYQGKLLGDLKRYPESYAAFERALQMQPTRASVYARRADVEIADGRSVDAIRDLERYPANGAEANQVKDKLNILRTPIVGKNTGVATASNTIGKPKVEDEAKEEKDLYDLPKAGRPSAADPAYEEESSPTWTKDSKGKYHASPDATPLPSPPRACSLYTWAPLQRCIEDFHVENDPLPGGIPNPHRWNDTLAARGRSLAAQHPDITWDPMRWKAIAEEEADKAHGSPQSDAPDAEMATLNRPPSRR